MKLEGKKVLVTGADGFIGSHLTERLVEIGCEVRALAYYNSFNNWGWLDTLPQEVLSQVEVIPGDIRDRGSVHRLVEGVDVVLHLAALIGIPYSYESPESYLETNIRGTLNVLEEVRREEVERVLITSTSEVYGTARYVPIDEAHPYQGQSPYSATKIAADRLGESYFRSFATPLTTVRPFNTYGPRQSARAVIPTVITQLLSGKQEIKLGALSPTRDMVFVKDTVAGFIALAESEQAIGEEVNIATGVEHSVEEIARTLIGIIQPEAKIVCDAERLRPDKSEVERLLGANEKIKSLTTWQPQWDLQRGLQETVEWFRQDGVMKNYKSDIFNV